MSTGEPTPEEIDRAHCNLLIEDNNGALLYGHELQRRMIATGKQMPMLILRGVPPELYIGYVRSKWGHLKEVQAIPQAIAGRQEVTVKAALLENISDAIELTMEDVEALRELARRLADV